MLFSFLRDNVRDTLMPQVSLFGLKFSVRNGISTSKLHPVLLRCTRSFQMPSHWRFWPFVPHQRVGHRPRWIGLEEIAGAPVEECVDGPLDLVVLLQEFVAALLVPVRRTPASESWQMTPR
jgi:hypothetical protein